MIGGSRGAGGAGGADGAAEAAKQLEAYFLRQVLSTMPKGAMFGGDGAASSTLHGMFNEVLADAVAEGGQVGLAKELQAAMARQAPHRDLRRRADADGEAGAGGDALGRQLGDPLLGGEIEDPPLAIAQIGVGRRRLHPAMAALQHAEIGELLDVAADRLGRHREMLRQIGHRLKAELADPLRDLRLTLGDSGRHGLVPSPPVPARRPTPSRFHPRDGVMTIWFRMNVQMNISAEAQGASAQALRRGWTRSWMRVWARA